MIHMIQELSRTDTKSIATDSPVPTSSITPTSRVPRLTLLAPDIVEAILGGRQPAEMTLAVLMRPFAVAWTEQRKTIFCWKNATSVSG